MLPARLSKSGQADCLAEVMPARFEQKLPGLATSLRPETENPTQRARVWLKT
jgi:hypothetical protein